MDGVNPTSIHERMRGKGRFNIATKLILAFAIGMTVVMTLFGAFLYMAQIQTGKNSLEANTAQVQKEITVSIRNYLDKYTMPSLSRPTIRRSKILSGKQIQQ